MERELKYIREATQDLDNIHDYIAENFYSEGIAKATVSKIVTGIKILKTSPGVGVSLDRKIGRKINPKYEVKMLILDQYLAFYTVTDDRVFVLRILNAKQDYMRFLNNFSALTKKTRVNEED
ncbi:MAG: type II toxin-antitoxin system RelE/ParE family toxin [Streptococcaceae bacterium]|jgi:plasmid stabilization system protein ParE|nr:type II toxin-antitoxin system RelE/ParE family toxin [Streptococcaceae bacterium]